MRKQKVENDDIGTVLSRDFTPCKPISGDENAKAHFAQIIPKQIRDVGLVFNKSTVSCMLRSLVGEKSGHLAS